MGYLGRRIGLSQNQGDSTPSGSDGAVGGGILDLFANGYFERQGDIYNAPGQAPSSGLTATGGVISDYSTPPGAVFRSHIFTSSGTFNVSEIGSYGLGVEYLLVAGGGGTAEGAVGRSGGSGAGGFLTGSTNIGIHPFAIVVGAGGVGGGSSPSQGVNTTGLSATAYGGGGGGFNDPPPASNGGNGGSGGGGWYINGGAGGKGVYPGSPYVDAPRQGYDGSPGFASPEYGGGGGGAGGAGGRRTGGAGAPNVYAYGPTNPVTYAAGGEANNYPGVYRNNAGAPGTGNGGSGFASGGSGVAIIRYQIAELTASQKASGGAISYYGGKTIHTFTSSGTFATNANWSAANVEYVIVAGGGGGYNNDTGGGGGAGGYRTGTTPIGAHPVSTSIQVGAGGAPSYVVSTRASNGGPSFFGSPITAAGGGGAGGGPSGAPGATGGSGGGAGYQGNGAAGNTPPTSPSQGFAGGDGGTPGASGGGGGGAGGVGGDHRAPYGGGHGGLGRQVPSTFRNPVSASGPNGGGLGYPGPTAPVPANNPGGDTSGLFWVGGGGGGSTDNPSPSAPQQGKGGGDGGPYAGGGNGGHYPQMSGSAGKVNSGGGGGGTDDGDDATPRINGSGGSGIVIIAYDT